MQLIWHQFVKDLRQFRLGLGFWWGLLVMDLVFGLLLPDWVRFDFHDRSWATRLTLLSLAAEALVVFLLWLGVLILPAVLVMSDSPLRENAFVRTRPVPSRAIIFSKLGFVGLCLLGPACLTELVHLLAAGAGLNAALHAAGERVLFLAPALLASGVFGGLWRTRKELVAGYLVLGGGAWGTFLVLYLIAMALEKLGLLPHWIDDPNASRLLMWEGAVLVGLLLVAWRAWRGRLRPWRRWLAVPLVTLAASLMGFFPSWNLFPIRPIEPERFDSAADDWSSVPIGWGQFQITSNSDASGGALSVGGTLDPHLPGIGDTETIDWTVMEADLELDSGDRRPFEYTGREPAVFSWRSGLSERDLRAFEPLLGGEALFFTDHGAISGGGMANLGRVLFDQMPTNRASVCAGLNGRVFRWSTVARLPLQEGARARDEAGSWSIVGLAPLWDEAHAIGLRRDQVALLTTADATRRRLTYWPATQHEFLFVDPKRQVVFLQQSPVWNSQELGSHTGFAHYYLRLELRMPELLRSASGPVSLDDLELWVLRRDFLGEIETGAHTPQIDLASLRPMSADEMNLVSAQNLDEAAFRHRIESITLPPVDAGRSQVASYLVQVLRLIDAQKRFLPEDDPIVMRLATLVPGHLELFLDACRYSGSHSGRVLLSAILRGTPEADASKVIAALPAEPGLAGVVLERGWETFAAPLDQRLAETPEALPLGVTRLLALTGEPAVRPRLLAEFELRPSMDTYEILQTLDGIEPDLESSLDAIWRDRSRVIRPDANVTRLAVLLQTGRRAALTEVFRVFRLVPEARRDRLWLLLDACREGIVMTGLDHAKRYDTGTLAAWLKDKQPDDFQWEPNRRRWLLRSAGPVTQP